jgi:hypothetical protein
VVRLRCYTGCAMPTKRRRHAITETPPVQAALDELRTELGSEQMNLGELVILGAREKLVQLRATDVRRATLRRLLADRVRAGAVPVDPIAADEVKRTGWARP